MRRIQFAPLVLLALTTPACVMDSVDNSSFIFGWDIEDVGSFNPGEACGDVGAETVAFNARNLATNTNYRYDFPCAGYAGQTPTLPTGAYAISIALLRPDGVEVSRRDLPLPGQAPPMIHRRKVTQLDLTIFQVQSFFAQWRIVRAGAQLDCTLVGATTVELTAQTPNMKPDVFEFPCAQGQGQTQAVQDGDYLLTVRLLRADRSVLSEFARPYTTPVGQIADLGVINFEL